MLSDEHDPVVVVEGDHAGRQIAEMDDAVDAGAAVRARDLVVPHGDPGVLVRDPPAVADEGTLHRSHRRMA